MVKVKLCTIDKSKKITLHNAYKVSYVDEYNQIGSASFSLPIDDSKNDEIDSLGFIQLIDGNFDEMYRIMPDDTIYDENTKEVTYQCIHVLSTLMDTPIVNLFQIDNRKTEEVINELLDLQTTEDWYLRRCDFTRRFSYTFENENGLANAIFSIPKPFDEAYEFKWDTSTYPWALELVRPNDDVIGDVRESINLKGFKISKNPNSVVNRIYAKGQGEGINALTFASINNGKSYVEDTESIQKLGRIIGYVWVDRRFTVKESLLASAKALLRKWKDPIVSWEISAVDLREVLNKSVSYKYKDFRCGQVIRVVTRKFGTVSLRILKLTKPDAKGAPWDIQLEIGAVKEIFGGTLTDSERQLEINTQYANGQTNVIPYLLRDDVDQAHPAKFKFYIRDTFRTINYAELTMRTTYYRAHSKAIKGGGAIVKSTSAGGQTLTSSTTSSGGGGAYGTTSSAGGGTTTSSSGAGDVRLKLFDIVEGPPDPSMGEQLCKGADGWILQIKSKYLGSFYSNGSTGNHSHSVSIPAHSHNVSINIPNHSHSVSLTIAAHTHEITLPDHTHDIEWGIFEYNKLPSKVTIKVDGVEIPESEFSGTSCERLNLVKYLSMTDGQISRNTYHEIEIIPNDLARIEAQLELGVFIQSNLGGEF